VYRLSKVYWEAEDVS